MEWKIIALGDWLIDNQSFCWSICFIFCCWSWTAFLFLIHLNLELLAQFPVSNEWKILQFIKKIHVNNLMIYLAYINLPKNVLSISVSFDLLWNFVKIAQKSGVEGQGLTLTALKYAETNSKDQKEIIINIIWIPMLWVYTAILNIWLFQCGDRH